MGADEISDKAISFRCVYDIKDFNDTQIINNKGKFDINKEIKSKIKMLNGNKKEILTYSKRFDHLGINFIDFIIEDKLTDLSFLFNKCSSLKTIIFFNIETDQVSNMTSMF